MFESAKVLKTKIKCIDTNPLGRFSDAFRFSIYPGIKREEGEKPASSTRFSLRLGNGRADAGRDGRTCLARRPDSDWQRFDCHTG